MFMNLNYQFEGIHLSFEGKEERYSYIDNEIEIGKIHLNISDNSLFIIFLETNEQYRKKGWGTKIVKELFTHFPQINKLLGYSTEEIMDGFWSKQDGFSFFGEGSDEQEGYLIFEINKAS